MAKKTIGQSCSGCLVLVILFIIAAPYMKGCVDRGIEAMERQREQAVITEQKLDVEKPLGTEERLRHDVIKALGTSNRKRKRLAVEVSRRSVTLVIAFNDNLTEGMIVAGSQSDITAALKAINDSGYNYQKILIKGYFLLSDKFGNSTDSEVVRLEYSKGTVERINWDSFLFDNVFDITDTVWLHPSFQEQ